MYVIGTAGHVDHGKSLLVEALTGIDPDRLREEKTRGMTIDLGFAWLTLPSGRSVSIVDVPGHERFIKNMLAGAGGIDLALLVVAADDGVMPQTREHLAILDLLDVRRGVVALTKRDLVDADWAAMVSEQISEALQETTLEGAPVVQCSAVTREGLDDLLHALDGAISELSPVRDIGKPRLPIDRVFTIGGFGTVVTGTLIGGAIEVGDELEAQPGAVRGRVRGLQSHRDKVERALPGTRTAVNLAGVAKEQLRRGMVLAAPGTLKPTNVVDARVRAVAALAHPVRHNTAVTFHCFADEASGVLRLLDRDELRAGEEAWAQIKLASPVAVERGDRFVLRTPNDTAGGGVIVDTAPKRHRRRHAPTLGALAAMLSDSPEDIVLRAIERTPMIEREALVRETSLQEEAVDAALHALVASGAAIVFDDGREKRAATPQFLRDAHARAVASLASYHAEHPLRGGMPREELRARTGLDARAFAGIAATWSDVRSLEATAALASFRPSPTATQQAQIEAYLAGLRAQPVSPPTAGRLEPELMAYVVDSGAIVDAGDGIVFDTEAFASMVERVRERISGRGSITLAEVRDLFETSRKYAQALLEEMDRRRVTRRVGDERVLR